ncbi:hypothetical protein N7452_003377 [Penicillium brevicompactum]|uniref:Uncharacterized protein n=1 Tax=Penicillium brevicompactum TaxID=5074 RepID=A0A9W9QVW0_PENBR|nr:hypothetical protein N7452_003377 [Penicillium brevicompactum]
MGSTWQPSRNRAQHEEPVDLEVRKYFEPLGIGNRSEWQLRPEIPSSEEIIGADTSDDDEVPLPINNIEGPWESKDQYLEAHYKLLREEAVGPIRDAVSVLRENPFAGDNAKDYHVYDNVYITGVTVTRSGLAIHVRFSTRCARESIDWASSTRLRPGTIVAMSPVGDNFRTKCLVVTVASRPLENVTKNPPEVDLFVRSFDNLDLDPQKPWLMVQSSLGYFEATKHTMTALQKLATEKFPLSERICSLNTNIGVPAYIQAQPVMSFESLPELTGPQRQNPVHNVIDDWPAMPMGQLDATQWLAMRDMVTQEISITQGPPGTGKTFTSLTALRLLLANKCPKDPPILIAAQTNHALDQILKQVGAFEKSYVRLGSRSTENEVRQHTIFEIWANGNAVKVYGGMMQPATKQHMALSRKIDSILEPLKVMKNSDKPLLPKILVRYGLLTEEQLKSLRSGAVGWVQGDTSTSATSSTTAMSDDELFHAWLGDSVTEFQYPYVEEFEPDASQDSEDEELKEHQLENEEGEADWFTIKGIAIKFTPGFCATHTQTQVQNAKLLSYLATDDLWSIPKRHRGFVYDALRKRLVSILGKKLVGLQEEYEDCAKTAQISRCERDFPILRRANVIGMTTTGLSKYRGSLASVKPRVILIEEAASVIEAPVAVACLPTIQQLILIGDHQQLRGNCAVNELTKWPFNLDVSMFERLVMNGMKFSRLGVQRRMIKEISRLVAPVYEDLQDHPSVNHRALIPGMGTTRSYFLQHSEPERKDSASSYTNWFEAAMVIGLLGHLLKNGVPADQITILTFYQGQRKLISKLKRQGSNLFIPFVEIATVDSYQGKENRIVILSLVRSNLRHDIGFLDDLNRSAVALSRARNGLFIFGNARNLIPKSEFWAEVVSEMSKDGMRRFGTALSLYCYQHRKRTLIEAPEDWDVIDVGCSERCGGRLPCNHPCLDYCHGGEHDWVSCDVPCDYVCPKCEILCTHLCSPPHEHICDCENKLVPYGHVGPSYSFGNTQKDLSDSGDESKTSPDSPPRGRSRTARPRRPQAEDLAPRPHEENLAQLLERHQAELAQKVEEVTGSSAIKDDQARPAVPASQRTGPPKQEPTLPQRNREQEAIRGRNKVVKDSAAANAQASPRAANPQPTGRPNQGFGMSQRDKEKQAVRAWKDFAQGGVIADDLRRAGLYVPPQYRHPHPNAGPPAPLIAPRKVPYRPSPLKSVASPKSVASKPVTFKPLPPMPPVPLPPRPKPVASKPVAPPKPAASKPVAPKPIAPKPTNADPSALDEDDLLLSYD